MTLKEQIITVTGITAFGLIGVAGMALLFTSILMIATGR